MRVAPHVGDSVQGKAPSSGIWVLPMITAPAARTRRTISAVGGRRLAVGVRAERRHLAGHVDLFLDRDRHAQQRALAAGPPTRIGLIGFEQRALAEHDPEGVQLRVEPRDPLQIELHQLARGDLASGDQLGLAGDPGESELGRVHRGSI